MTRLRLPEYVCGLSLPNLRHWLKRLAESILPYCHPAILPSSRVFSISPFSFTRR